MRLGSTPATPRTFIPCGREERFEVLRNYPLYIDLLGVSWSVVQLRVVPSEAVSVSTTVIDDLLGADITVTLIFVGSFLF